ncbi:MAG TPA: hypothetical protein PKD64_07860 [Pirellulaceae bacterium]|nr:hypothetical protein [Pirellulaceae bacterium]HMO92103.1 hypothetical protein [Pirellulaceae bacterium]HMP69309.1 hypothetical protein [Pirellulaceae bacterium]
MFLIFASQQQLANAQYSCYRMVPQTIYEQQKVVTQKWVAETQYQEQLVKTYKPIWTTEQRERTYKVLKPVVETSEREERQVVYKPVYETSYQEQTIQRTEWETVTEMREERQTVLKPVTETSMREEQIVVRKPITETIMQSENVTTLRPVTTTQTVLSPTLTPSTQLVYSPGPVRNRLQWLQRGYYPDASGALSYRTGGLYWVPQENLGSYQWQTGYTPSLVQQEVQQTNYVQETTVVQRPVQQTRYVDEVQVRQTPVTVQKYVEETQVRQVPVTVQRPVTKHFVQKTPIQTLRYETEVVVRKVPITRQTMVEEIRTEPYSVQTCRWEETVQTLRVPQTVLKPVMAEVTQLVPRTTWVNVPVDAFGTPIYSSVPTLSPTVVARPVVTYSPGTTYYSQPQISSTIVPEYRSNIIAESRIVPVTPSTEWVEVTKPVITEQQAERTTSEADRQPELDKQQGQEVNGEIQRRQRASDSENENGSSNEVNLKGPEQPERDIDEGRG